MDKFLDDIAPHRKKSKKKSPTKSDHKHVYEFVKIEGEEDSWFTHEKKCTICGYVLKKVREGYEYI